MAELIVSKEFGGVPYRLERLTPRRGGLIAARVGQLLAAAIGDDAEAIKALSSALKPSAEEGATPPKLDLAKMLSDNAGLLAAFTGGVARLDVDKLYAAAFECVQGKLFAHVGQENGQRLHDDTAFDKHFNEYPANLLPVLVWALQVNASGFFAFGGRG